MSSIKKSEDIASQLERVKLERESVRDRLNEINPRRKRERRDSEHFGSYAGNRDEFDSKRRIIPSSVSISGSGNIDGNDTIVITDEVREERKAAMQSRMSNTSDNMQNRNRRMFGNLLGHLNKARTIISKDQSLFDRQRKLENDVVEREKKESEIIRAVQIQVKKEQAEKEMTRLNELEMEERTLRLKKTLQNRINGFTTLSKYCLTNSQPAIYFLPANGNSQTDEYLEKSKKIMEEKIEEERKRIDGEIEAIQTQMQMKMEERKRAAENKMEEEKKEEKEEETPKVDSKMLNLNSDSDEEEEKKEQEMEVEEKEEKEEEKKMEVDEKKEENTEEKCEEKKEEEKMDEEVETKASS